LGNPRNLRTKLRGGNASENANPLARGTDATKPGSPFEGDLTSVLSHNDPKHQNKGKQEIEIQQISPVKQTNKHKNSSNKSGEVGAFQGGA